jgi:hypothetical protein
MPDHSLIKTWLSAAQHGAQLNHTGPQHTVHGYLRPAHMPTTTNNQGTTAQVLEHDTKLGSASHDTANHSMRAIQLPNQAI